MIDNTNRVYHHYRSLIKQVYDNYVNMEGVELEAMSYKVYQDNCLSEHQYDSLCDLLCDL